ncbi:MAG: ABC transporter ATP-binding protein [Victivallaceae bacterium]|nr:ABC transporter ATP-binding protein [Victivallaceae bacterium]
MPMNDIAIEIKDLTKTFAVERVHYGFKNMILHLPQYIRDHRSCYHHTALNHINLTIRRGERVGISGHNGCGKTTLLSVIGGVCKSFSGSVQVNGQISMMLALCAGFCMELSGRDNIVLNGVLQGKTRKEMAALMDDIVDFADIGEYIDAPVYQYSSGMQARLGFGIITAIKPDILLVDEVMAVGDADFREKSEKRINRLLDNGCTLLLVSHNHDDIRKYCQRAIKMEHGSIVYDGGI